MNLTYNSKKYIKIQIEKGNKIQKMSSKVAEQKKLNDQLKREASVKPMKVSDALKELIDYIETNQKTDVLAAGFANQNDNPYKEKAGCLVS